MTRRPDLQVHVRMPAELKGRLEAAAERSNRTLTAEIDMVTLSRSDLEISYNKLREALEDIVRQASGRDTGWGHYTDGYAAGKIDAAKIARRALGGSND